MALNFKATLLAHPLYFTASVKKNVKEYEMITKLYYNNVNIECRPALKFTTIYINKLANAKYRVCTAV